MCLEEACQFLQVHFEQPDYTRTRPISACLHAHINAEVSSDLHGYFFVYFIGPI
jgi:hypothetical protein